MMWFPELSLPEFGPGELATVVLVEHLERVPEHVVLYDALPLLQSLHHQLGELAKVQITVNISIRDLKIQISKGNK